MLASSKVEQVMRSGTRGHSEYKGGRKKLRSKRDGKLRNKRRGREDALGKRRDDDGEGWEGHLTRLAHPRLETMATRVRANMTAGVYDQG